MPRRLAIVCLVAVAVAATRGTAQAQIGARAMGMGGAFVGLADDAEATFYNPAGLAFQPCANATITVTANNSDQASVRDFVSFVTPFDENSALGFSFSRALLASLRLYDPDDGFGSLEWTENQYWFSGAYRFGEKFSVGANVRWTKDNIAINLGDWEPRAHVDTDMSWDLGLMYCISSQARVGLMVRDVNQPAQSITIEDFTVEGELNRTYSLGAAFKNPGGLAPGMTAVIQVEDVGDAIDRSFRVGVEQQMKRGCYTYAWRAGWYGDENALTVGAGVNYNGWQGDVAVANLNAGATWLVSVGTTF